MRDHLEQAGKSAPSISVSIQARHVLQWFMDLHSSRGNNGFGYNPITYTDIAHWASLIGADPQPWEVRAIRLMDSAFLEEAAKHG